MRVDTVVDERTLRELYLTGFEIAVRESAPWTVMCAYNLVNGEHAGESRRLLTDILRDEWGFDGLVMSDWGAVARPGGRDPCRAGPRDALQRGGPGTRSGRAPSTPARSTRPTSTWPARAWSPWRCVPRAPRGARAEAASRRPRRPPRARPRGGGRRHRPADQRRAAARSRRTAPDRGRSAPSPTTPRYQGAGSSLVQPDPARHRARRRCGSGWAPTPSGRYVAGLRPADGRVDARAARRRHAVAAADGATSPCCSSGLPASHESEGFDRDHLRLPTGQDRLVEVVTAANPRTVVVLGNGGAVELPWADRPAALLEAYLGGQAGGSALVDVLLGDAEPGGRLAESFPVVAEELPRTAASPTTPPRSSTAKALYVGLPVPRHLRGAAALRVRARAGLHHLRPRPSSRSTGTGTDLHRQR